MEGQQDRPLRGRSCNRHPHPALSRISQDRYNDPGRPMIAAKHRRTTLLQTTPDKRGANFSAPGASPQGDMPFVAIMPVGNGKNPPKGAYGNRSRPSLKLRWRWSRRAMRSRYWPAVSRSKQSPNYFLTGPLSPGGHLKRGGSSCSEGWTAVTRIPQSLCRIADSHPPVSALQTRRRRRPPRRPLSAARL